MREEVVVTAERGPAAASEIPASVSVLTRPQIDALPANDLGELVGYLPGFHALFSGAFGGPPPIVMSRGFFGGGEADYVQLRVDGVPVQDVESGLADWRNVRAGNVDRIEGLRGPGSSLYGDAAMGGVIQVFTQRPADGSARFAASASAGSYGTAAAGASWDFARGGFDGGLGGTYVRTDGSRAHDAERTGLFGFSLDGPLAEGQWTLAAAGSSTHREDPGALDRVQFENDDRVSDPLYRFDETQENRGRIALTYRQDSGPIPFQATLYGAAREADILQTLPVAPGLGNRTLRDLHSGTAGVIVEGGRGYTLFAGSGQARVGAELSRDTLRSNYRFVDDEGNAGPIVSGEDGSRGRQAVFFTTDWSPTARLRLSAGVRFDRLAYDFPVAGGQTRNEAWSPRAGVNYRIGNLSLAPVAVYFQYSQSFKAPTLDQLFDPHPFDDFSGSTFSISNPSLVPQRARNLEVGVSQEGRGWQWQALAYRMTVRDEIDFDPATFTYQNIGQSLHRGVEASVRVAVGPFLWPVVSYAWTRVTDVESATPNAQLKNIPEHLLLAGAVARLPAGLRLEVDWTWMGGRYLDDADVFPLGNASVVNLRAARDFGPLNVWFDLLNLTNARYAQYGYALTGFDGRAVPYDYPGARLGARVGVRWTE